MNNFKYYIFISLSLIKRVSREKLYLNIIAPLLGYYHLFKIGTLDKVILPLIAMVFVNLIPTTINFTLVGYMKWAQFLGLVLFISFCSRFSIKGILSLISCVEAASVILYLIEFIFFEPYLMREFFKGQAFGRYAGIVGEPNFSALLFFILFLINFHNKRYKNSILDLLLIIPTQSRTAYLVILLFALIRPLQRFVNKKVVLVIFAISQLYPYIVMYSWDYLNDDLKLKIAEKTADRYIIHAAHTDLNKYKILGSGFGQFNDKFNFENIPTKYHNVIKMKNQNYTTKQQHNTPLQVLTEFGIVGLLFFSVFQVIIMNLCFKVDRNLALGWGLIFIFTLSLNTLSEVFIYVFISYILICAKRNDESQTINFKERFISLFKRS